MILLLDNHDSFTYNLFHYVSMMTREQVDVVRNDRLNLSELSRYSRILLSPGPGLPEESGCLMDVIAARAGVVPILGVCLGHQALGMHFGFKMHNLSKPYHGISKPVVVTDRTDRLYDGLPDVFPAGRYHSWVLRSDTQVPRLRITAVDEDHEIMSVSDTTGRIKGIQFHPESVLSGDYGKQLIGNWLQQPI